MPEPLPPVGAEFGGHAPLYKRPAHRRRIGLQVGKLLRIFGGKRVGDSGQNLGHLHQRPLQPTQRLTQILGMGSPVEREAEQTLARQPGGQTANAGSDPGIAAHAPLKRAASRSPFDPVLMTDGSLHESSYESSASSRSM